MIKQMLIDNIDILIATAMKNGEQSLNTLRMIKTELVNFIKSGKVLNHSEEQKILSKMSKERQENVQIYTANNRSDLADKEQKEFDYISQFIDKAPDIKEVEEFVQNQIDLYKITSDSFSMKDMKFLLAKVRETYDFPEIGKIVSDAVKKNL